MSQRPPYGQPYTQQIVAQQRQSPNLFLRILYFIFIGWWLSGLWISLAWFFIVLIITMPLGFMMINSVPLIVSLKALSSEYVMAIQGSIARIKEVRKVQLPWILRALYFILVGWWLSGLWMGLAWLVCLTIIGIPLTIWMYDRVPAVTTLRRY
jgi:uncharacterized membrane protein YccF (DUF307 family)